MDYSKIRREYIHEALEVESMDNDPLVVFQQWFDEAYKLFGLETNAMSLATADERGRPSVRIVLLKGVSPDGFLFYTNYTSRKGRQLTVNPYAALLFYWPGMDRQVRIEGHVSRVSSERSDAYFHSRPIGSQISAAISPQSEKITLEQLQEKRSKIEQITYVERPVNWGGYQLTPDYFEFWNGRESRFHDRIVYEKSRGGNYDRYRIAP
ncbi:pyridoxamine 5'-phosphate oxidase [Membranicola marinus]|uniref:Pyridoxine/pyridoxamine 5'-phosphate oxidase n=1 Tax=Membranihabitans marinus TaxID=1227546 RepID=A0A953L6A3_9BACT|nr:pyridoxamine 5'-phosphate oxidase [Membranihabitans marinus]MBY5957447.1 pyridoxamine 5'-phosphate oxidase [Membranihabitans marinus]